MNNEHKFTLKDAQTTVQRADDLIEYLAGAEQNGISIAPRQSGDLQRFIRAYRNELDQCWEKLNRSQAEIDRQLLSTRRMELEEAVRFVERSFVEPRKFGSEVQILEAADWLCVEGFHMFVGQSKEHPTGPIVAIDSAQSPAVWAPDAALPIPALFRTEPKRIDRQKHLAEFPLICLPGHLTRSPEFLPLLSHEVGHAVDHVSALSDLICKEISDASQIKYWAAWMREIVADAVGVTISGEAFLVALDRYLNSLPPFVEVSSANFYPPNPLRLAFVGACLNHYGETLMCPGRIPLDVDVRKINRKSAALLIEFQEIVLPSIAKHILNRNVNWVEESKIVQSMAASIVAKPNDKTVQLKASFHLLPSVITLAHQDDAWDSSSRSTFKEFRDLHSERDDADRPPWVGGETNWVFSEEHLPSLRPTLLGGDGKFKVPPLLLLATHQRIAFVGASNWQLRKSMSDAFAARDNVPWDEIHLFFANDELLQQVEYGERDAKVDRDESQAELAHALKTLSWAKKWTIYRFDGPPVFASFWDWDQRGGRIHVSPALLGTEIGRCPASDHIWQHASPTDHYKKYVKHLDALLRPIPGTSIVNRG